MLGVVGLGVFVVGLALPERVSIPVADASPRDWNPQSFWFEPWGISGVHKGIDIFGHKGKDVLSSVDGLVLYAGQVPRGGKVVAVLGPKWRVHYYAHLQDIGTHKLRYVTSGEPIGTLGDTGNAKGKPAHLHYAIVRLYPAVWDIDGSTQGYKKAFYMDPNRYLSENARNSAAE